MPYRDRIQPGDLSPGDLLPTEEDDPRLVPGYLCGDPGDDVVDQDSLREVVDELGLGRARVLSLEGRDLAAERWYDGSHGPDVPLAQSAPATLRRPAASWSGWPARCPRRSGSAPTRIANDDGRVVSLDHGCGAHSEAQLAKKQPAAAAARARCSTR